MRTQEDLRSALASLERLAPDPQQVLAAAIQREQRTSLPAGARWRRGPGWAAGRRAGWLAGVAALIAAGAVAAALVVAGGTGRPRLYRLPGVVAAAPAGAATARQVLLTAARNVARNTPPAAGRYWVSAGAVGNYIRVGPPGDSYVILEKTLREDWVARSPALESDTYARALSVGFASAADRAAWRRDGSPSSWGYGQDLTFADPDGLSSGGTEKITTARGPLMNLFGGTGGVDPTKGQPASPARLKKILLRGYSRADSGGQSPASWIFQMAPRLFELPTTAAVRAGLYQLLASLPGVTSLGTVRDAGGQQGVAVALSSHVARCGGEYKLGLDNPLRLFPDCVVQQRIVIDPQTGEPLAQELRYLELPVGQKWSAPGGLFSYELFSPGRWTRAKLPPRGN